MNQLLYYKMRLKLEFKRKNIDMHVPISNIKKEKQPNQNKTKHKTCKKARSTSEKKTWSVGVVHKQKMPQPYSVDTKRCQYQSGRY